MSTTSPEPDPSDLPRIPAPTAPGRARAFVDVAERTLATYLETFVSLLLVADHIGLSAAAAAAVAAIPAALAVVKEGLSRFLLFLDPTRTDGSRFGFAYDLAERSLFTYLEALVAFLAVAERIDISTVTAASLAGIPAALAVIKGTLARFLGDRESAAVIPARFLTQQV